MIITTDENSCPHNHEIRMQGCGSQSCQKCGWNPEEEERRKEKLRMVEEAGKLVNGEPLRV